MKTEEQQRRRLSQRQQESSALTSHSHILGGAAPSASLQRPVVRFGGGARSAPGYFGDSLSTPAGPFTSAFSFSTHNARELPQERKFDVDAVVRRDEERQRALQQQAASVYVHFGCVPSDA